MKRYLALLLAGLVISCGGGGDGGSTGGSTPTPTPTPTPSPTPTSGAGKHVQESDPAVTFSGAWTSTPSHWGSSGGAAVQSSVAGATASFSFTGTSVRWYSARGGAMGFARVSVDGGPPRQVQLYSGTGDIYRTPAITIHDLSDGPHTLTIEVISGVVVVDAFDVQPTTTISHWQDTNPNVAAALSAGWTKADPNTGYPWSGNGDSNIPELPVTAQETYVAGETVTLPFRGTGISWVGYQGPDGGIAQVRVDGGPIVEIDTYSPTQKFQQVVFTATGLTDGNHTLTITTTGNKNPASSAARIVVDAFDVMTPGRRYENNDPAITYNIRDNWERNHTSRVWSGGSAATSNIMGSTATFSFTGTSVSWIGCRKSSAGGTARVYIDGVFIQEIRLKETYPIEGYQMTVFRRDGLAPGPHTLTIEVVSPTGGSYVVVDAFDVHP